MRTSNSLMLAVFTLVGCGSGVPSEPEPDAASTKQTQVNGTGLVLDSITGVAVPVIGQLAEVVIDQAIITELFLIEDIAGQVVGIEAEGVLQLTGGVLGTDVVSEDFRTELGITSSGRGKCSVLTVDLGPIGIDALGLASVDVPAAAVNARASGAVGSLLCNLGAVLGGLGSGGAGGLVNAINNQI